MSEICSQPQAVRPPAIRFQLEETYDDGTPETRLLPSAGGFFSDTFIGVINIEETESPPSGDLGILSTQDGEKKLEIKQCFVPVLIRWKHYTTSAGTGITTSTDEEVELNVNNPHHTWPNATDYVAGVTDGEWDADFEMWQVAPNSI